MARYSKALTEVFEACGDSDVDLALSTYANTAPDEWSEFVDRSAGKEYLRCYLNWVRSHVKEVERERLTEHAGQARLFELPPSPVVVEFRERLILDGREHELATLADPAVIRKVASRDLTPAVTTVERCKGYFALADHMEAESERLGRPVTAGEVLGWAA